MSISHYCAKRKRFRCRLFGNKPVRKQSLPSHIIPTLWQNMFCSTFSMVDAIIPNHPFRTGRLESTNVLDRFAHVFVHAHHAAEFCAAVPGPSLSGATDQVHTTIQTTPPFFHTQNRSVQKRRRFPPTRRASRSSVALAIISRCCVRLRHFRCR